MAKKERRKDWCRICGKIDYLTEEHLIPQAAGNMGQLRAQSLETMGHKTSGRKFQNGLVRRTLCGECNHRAGKHYVPAFAKWTRMAQYYHDRSRLNGSAILSIETYPLEVVKQIAVIALAMSEMHSALLPHFIELRRFAWDPERRGNLPRFRFFTYLNYGDAQFDGYHCPMSMDQGVGPVIYCHVALQPLGYIVTTDHQWCMKWAVSKRLCDLTKYSDRPPKTRANVQIVLPCIGNVHAQ